MNIAVLQASGKDLSLQELIDGMSFDCDNRWKAGDSRRHGAVHGSSGFNVTIADENNPVELVESVRIFLSNFRISGFSLAKLDVTAEISLGFTVGDSEQYSISVGFLPGDLALLAQLGFSLEISAYPTSDKTNEC